MAEIYRYQDKTGKWHFSDEKPSDTKKNVETIEAKSVNVMASVNDGKTPIVNVPKGLCKADLQRRATFYTAKGGHLGQKGTIKINNVGTGNTTILMAQNEFFAPVTVQVVIDNPLGIQSNPPLPLVTQIDPHSEKKIVTIKPIDPGLPWKGSYRYAIQLGPLNPQHDNNCYYLPPVPADKPYRISQSFNGRFSHTHPSSRYAVDISMDEGTPIVAARDGIVIARKTDFVLSGLSAKYKTRANTIEIMHGDGTIAIYAHLKFRTIQFYEGDEVKAGQLIGRSGNTGYSTGPHLHFVVVANRNMRMQAVPFKFMINGTPTVPVTGHALLNFPFAEK